ncbi:CDP-glycerol glycerophosphotransferase family protein [Enterococcus sp. LJL98]
MTLRDKVKKILPAPKELAYLKYRKQPVQPNTILLEGSHGREFSGHIYALAKALKVDYPEYQFKVAVRKNVVLPREFAENRVEHGSRQYLSLLATAEILINDTSFWSFFHKRNEQKYYIFWHGTPLKCLGKATQVQGYGNVQRNFAAADQIFVSNEFTREKLARDFGVENIVDNEFVVGPSPRNSQLFVHRVIPGRYLYMPTWRGTDLTQVSVQQAFYTYLQDLDKGLTDSEELYIKLHPYEAQLLEFNEADYQHLKLYPAEIEVYEFLQTVEKLITDYSSIMFDFALTRRDILLFTYDKAAYLKDRGMYLEMDCLPFPQFNNTQELLAGLRTEREPNQNQLIESFYQYDSKAGTQIVLDYLLEKQDHQQIQVYSNWNQKENVLIYAYQLADNGITASLLNLFKKIDLNKRNYVLIWQEGMISKALEYKIKQLPQGVYTFIQMEKVQATLLETLATGLYMNGFTLLKDQMHAMYQRDFQRCFPQMPVQTFIHYPGYDRSYCVWISALQELGIATMIFVHTDMEKEFQVNPTLKAKVIYEAYQQASTVVCVTNQLVGKIQPLAPSANLKVMNVLLNEQEIKTKAKQENGLELPVDLEVALTSQEITVFVSVGRFSKQKGYDRLIHAFEQLGDLNTRLVLICSYGPEKNNLEQQIAQSSRKESIYLFVQCPNPYYLVKRSNAFVFSSRYEGLGMVVFEALALSTPVIMTRIPETLEVLGSEKAAIVVENSEAGLLEGMTRFLAGERPGLHFDFQKYEEKNLAIWEQLFMKD